MRPSNLQCRHPVVESAMTEYKLLRDELIDLQTRFEGKAFPLVPLYHDLIWSPEMAGWTDEEYAAFRAGNADRQDFKVEEWELWPGAIACSRYYGNGVTPQTWLVDFRNLAARAYRVLCGFLDLQRRGYPLPNGFRLNLNCLSEERPDQPGSASYFGWLELLSEAALYSPTIRLQADNGWWRYEGKPNETRIEPIIQHTTTIATGKSYRTYPPYIALHIDLIEASAEFIQYCLEPETVVPVGNGLSPIFLPDEPETPLWDDRHGELWFQDRLIKQFTKPADNQRQLLGAFEASGWQGQILNPFRNEKTADYLMDELLQRTVEDLNKTLPADAGFRFGRLMGGMYATWSEN